MTALVVDRKIRIDKLPQLQFCFWPINNPKTTFVKVRLLACWKRTCGCRPERSVARLPSVQSRPYFSLHIPHWVWMVLRCVDTYRTVPIVLRCVDTYWTVPIVRRCVDTYRSVSIVLRCVDTYRAVSRLCLVALRTRFQSGSCRHGQGTVCKSVAMTQYESLATRCIRSMVGAQFCLC
jgi:hypothetical protein